MYAGGYVGSYGGVYNGYSPPAGLPSPPMSVPSPHSQVHGQVKKSAMMMDNRVPVMNSHPQNHNQSVSINCDRIIILCTSVAQVHFNIRSLRV